MIDLKSIFGVALIIAFAADSNSSADDTWQSPNTRSAHNQATVNVDDELPTIKMIMQVAHKDGLLKKVATGAATAEEREQLLKHYQELATLKPARGPEDSWQEKTSLMIEAARAAVESDPTAPVKLKTSTDCAACHDVHK